MSDSISLYKNAKSTFLKSYRFEFLNIRSIISFSVASCLGAFRSPDINLEYFRGSDLEILNIETDCKKINKITLKRNIFLIY